MIRLCAGLVSTYKIKNDAAGPCDLCCANQREMNDAKCTNSRCKLCQAPKDDTLEKKWGPKPRCNDKDFVYTVVCQHCGKSYIGETKQTAAKRFSQHLPNMNGGEQPDSAIALHHVQDHPGQPPKLCIMKLCKGGGHVLRKCQEAVRIKIADPDLNRRIEGSGAMDLYF